MFPMLTEAPWVPPLSRSPPFLPSEVTYSVETCDVSSALYKVYGGLNKDGSLRLIYVKA